MNDYITQEEFDIVEDLVMKATQACTKTSAAYYIKQLSFQKSYYCGYTEIIFSNLVSSVERAAGQVAEKDRKMYFVNQDLGKLRGRIKV